jgi:hypothetical protein
MTGAEYAKTMAQDPRTLPTRALRMSTARAALVSHAGCRHATFSMKLA